MLLKQAYLNFLSSSVNTQSLLATKFIQRWLLLTFEKLKKIYSGNTIRDNLITATLDPKILIYDR